jgi:LPPG:FO 2-phospho-L-lactate transferase
MQDTKGPIVVLAGGVGAARFLEGLVSVVRPEDVYVIVNVGDDFELCGMYISPDIDTITYTLAGVNNGNTGWGLQGDTTVALDQLRFLGGPSWFSLGDKDIGTHLYRTARIRQGAKLSVITSEIASALDVKSHIVPVTDQPLRTIVQTDEGDLSFQEYFVSRQQRDVIKGLRYSGADSCKPAPGVQEIIQSAEHIIIAPSNPFLSIRPILAVPTIRECLVNSSATIVSVSPIVAGNAIKGPAAAMLHSLGHDVSALGFARLYQGLVDVFIIDQKDKELVGLISEETGAECVIADTIMRGLNEKRSLAATVLTAHG